MGNATALGHRMLFNVFTGVPTAPGLGSGGAHPSLGAQAGRAHITSPGINHSPNTLKGRC